jgi:uncharacterized delta-60 repeat protein
MNAKRVHTYLLVWLIITALSAVATRQNTSAAWAASPTLPDALGGRWLAPDASFGANGRVATNFGSLAMHAMATDVIVQPDGKILSAGRLCQTLSDSRGFSPDCGVVVVVRHTTGGNPDATFGAGGILTSSLTFDLDYGDNSQRRHLALQPDGRIVIGGSLNGRAALARYLSNGQLDTAFGSGGLAVAANDGFMGVIALALQSDGRILAAGKGTTSSAACNAVMVVVARYSADGQPDVSFGNGGQFAACAIPPGIYPNVYAPTAIAVQSDGGIVVVADKRSLFRLQPNGQLDPTFGVNGLADFGEVVSISVLPDDRVVLADQRTSLTRLIANGGLDKSFGTNGVATHALSGTVASLTILPDGKLIRAGSVYVPGPNAPSNPSCCGRMAFWLTRHNADGSLDMTFGADGVFIQTIGDDNSTAYAVAVGSNGKIVAGGYTVEKMRSRYVVARFSDNGPLDPSFGAGGVLQLTFTTGSNDSISALRLQADGKVIAVGGALTDFGLRRAAISRYLSNGALDPTFGNGGTAMPSLNQSLDRGYVHDVAVQYDGKIIIAFGLEPTNCVRDYVNCDTNTFGVMRYTADGIPDASFGNSGVVTTTIMSYATDVQGVAIRPDGKIEVFGSQCKLVDFGNSAYCVSGFTEFRLFFARFLPDGSRDASFGVNGFLTAPYQFAPSAYAVLPDGKMLVAVVGARHIGVQRFTTDGLVDATFGANGVATVELTNTMSYPNQALSEPSLTLQADGKIILASTRYNQGRDTSALGLVLVRFTAEGALDASFGVGGWSFLNGHPGGVRTLSVLPDDGLALASVRKLCTTTYPDPYPSCADRGAYVTRLRADGQTDATFGVNGRFTLTDAPDAVMQIDPAGNVLLGGVTRGDAPTDFALARYREFTPTNSLLLPFAGNNTNYRPLSP